MRRVRPRSSSLARSCVSAGVAVLVMGIAAAPASATGDFPWTHSPNGIYPNADVCADERSAWLVQAAQTGVPYHADQCFYNAGGSWPTGWYFMGAYYLP